MSDQRYVVSYKRVFGIVDQVERKYFQVLPFARVMARDIKRMNPYADPTITRETMSGIDWVRDQDFEEAAQ